MRACLVVAKSAQKSVPVVFWPSAQTFLAMSPPPRGVRFGCLGVAARAGTGVGSRLLLSEGSLRGVDLTDPGKGGGWVGATGRQGARALPPPPGRGGDGHFQGKIWLGRQAQEPKPWEGACYGLAPHSTRHTSPRIGKRCLLGSASP